jgi:hypothetical protein
LVYIPNAGFVTYTTIGIPAGGIEISRTFPAVPSFNTNDNKDHGHGNGCAWSVSPFGSAVYDGKPSMLAILFGGLSNTHTDITNLRQDFSVGSCIGQNA